MVVAAGVIRFVRATNFGHRRASELAAPNDQCRIQESPLFQIMQQRRGGTVGHLADLDDVLVDLAVVVPTGVSQHDKAHAAFHHPPCQQAVRSECAGGLVLGSIGRHCGRRLLREIQQIWRRCLHSKGEFIGMNARLDFRVAGTGVMHPVEIADGVQT